METMNLLLELTPAHLLMAGLGLQMLAMTAMWLVAEAVPAGYSARPADLRRHLTTAEILRADFPNARVARRAVARVRAPASAMMERNAA